jgi:alpha-1,6-mannosyltransferase
MESVAATVNGGVSTSPSTAPPLALRALGIVGLVGVVASVFGVVAGAAGRPTPYVPARSGGWPSWLYGPLHELGLGIGSGSFQALTLVMCVSYLAVLLAANALSGRAIALAIVAANVLLLLGPPLISQDVFGYLAFARMGVLHGLDPYTHVAAETPTDAVFPFIGWPFQHSPYGPLFTLATYPLAWLGLGGGLWALKALAVAASLGAVALTASAASRMGRSAKAAAVFVGLNPVLLELALGGAHNDTLVLLILAGALVLTAELTRQTRTRHAEPVEAQARDAEPVETRALACGVEAGARKPPNLRAAGALLVLGVGVKASAGVVLPFVLLAPRYWRERAGVLGGAFGAVVLVAIIAVVGFGGQAFGFLGALNEQQQLIATHSFPAETARWVGLSGVPGWWRNAFLVGLALVLALTLWRTARGADWRAMAGWATLALLLSTAWLLPWYAIWALPLAALADSRRLRIATLALCAYAVLIHLPLAEPLLSPARHVHRPAALHGRVISSCGSSISPTRRLAVCDDVVFAGLQVKRHAALDLLG